MRKTTQVKYTFSGGDMSTYAIHFIQGAIAYARELVVTVTDPDSWSAGLYVLEATTATRHLLEARNEADLAEWPQWAVALVRETVPEPPKPSLFDYDERFMYVTAFDGVLLDEPVLYHLYAEESQWYPVYNTFLYPAVDLEGDAVHYQSNYQKVTDWLPAVIAPGAHA